MKFWICAVAKMEELYIREWIEYHKKLGVDHIIIGDNNDSDYEYPLCHIIQDYIDEGFVEVINKNDVLSVQLDFYNEIYSNRKSEFDWIGFIDIDEFVELPAYDNNIHKFLTDDKFKNTDSIIFPWLIYGDNEQVYYIDKPVKERFTKSVYCETLETKFFIKSIEKVVKFEAFNSPLNCIATDGYGTIKCCDCLGNYNFKYDKSKMWICDDYTYWYNDKQLHVKDLHWINNIYCDDEYYKNAYLSHYITKSTEEYIKYKTLRGRCDRNVGNYEIRHNKDLYFQYNTYNEEKNNMFISKMNEIKDCENEQLQKYKMT